MLLSRIYYLLATGDGKGLVMTFADSKWQKSMSSRQKSFAQTRALEILVNLGVWDSRRFIAVIALTSYVRVKGMLPLKESTGI